MFAEIVENWTPNCGLLLQIYTTKGVLYILVPQLMKFWNIKFEIVYPHFKKNKNKYSTKKCETLVVGMVLGR
jgi:isoprenylcysteine carboxyl methyltransferase (ICMT) family protein YpbQ